MFVAVEAASPLTKRLVDACLPAGVLLLVLGVALAAYELWIEFKLRAAALAAAAAVKETGPGGTKEGDVQAHGALADTVTAVTELARVMKDLQRSGQVLVVGVLVLAVAALAAGLDAVGQH